MINLNEIGNWWRVAKFRLGFSNKITGHHPGWANKQTEAAIDSDFTAGRSWTNIKNALKLMGIKTGSGKKSIQLGLSKWAKRDVDRIMGDLSKNISLISTKAPLYAAVGKSTKAIPPAVLRGAGYVGDKVPGQYIVFNLGNITQMAEKAGVSTSAQLKTSLAHEALEATVKRSITPTGLDKLSPDIAKAFNRVIGWSHRDIGVITGEIRFARAFGKEGYKMLQPYRSKDLLQSKNLYKKLIVPSLESVQGPKDEALARSFHRFSKRYSKILSLGYGKGSAEATAISTAMRNNIGDVYKYMTGGDTAGYTNKVLHEMKTMHSIGNTVKKTEHLFKT